ncbi:MAG: YtxH domain-containing protein [Ferruginibacter sp.]
MKSGKLITGVAVGAVVALILIPQTRKMISDAVCSITDSLNELMDKTNNLADKGKNELNTIVDKSKDMAGEARKTKEAWQS